MKMCTLQPPGTGNRLPEGLCVMSLFNEVAFYSQLLNAVEERMQLQSNGVAAAHELLRSAHDLAFPMPNSDVHVPIAVSFRFQL